MRSIGFNRTCGGALALLAGLALSGAAFAQPAATDLGTLTPGVPVVVTANVAASSVVWYTFTISDAYTSCNARFLDAFTSASAATPFSSGDTEIGVYDAAGNFVGTDDDDGPGSYSALSFGTGSSVTVGGTGLLSNGRDRHLAPGTYYVAVSGFSTTHNATNWSVVSTSTATGNIDLNLNAGTITNPAEPAGVIDLGTMAANDTRTSSGSIAANEIKWFKVTVPATSAALGNYFDADTEGSVLAATNDTYLAMFRADGRPMLTTANAALFDNDDGSGSLSQLTFGITTPTRPAVGTSLVYNGRDGVLPACTYYFAIRGGSAGSSLSATTTTNFNFTSTSTNSGTYQLNLRTGLPSTPPSGAGTAAPNVGQDLATTLVSVLVTPGNNPVSSGITVTADLSGIGGSATQGLNDLGVDGDAAAGDGRYSYLATVADGTTPGAKTFNFTVADAELRSTNGSITFTALGDAPANEDCSGAVNLGNSTATVAWDNSSAITGGQQAPCGPTNNDVWFRWTAPSSGIATINTDGTGTVSDTVMTVWAGCGGAEIACDDDGGAGLRSQVVIPVISGTEYFIQVGSFSTAIRGTGSLNFSIAPYTGACCTTTSCSILSAADCATAGGNYLGDNTLCSNTSFGSPFAYAGEPPFPIVIPDNTLAGVDAVWTISGSGQTIGAAGIAVSVGLTHTYVGDVYATISNGTTTVSLFGNRGGTAALGGVYRFYDAAPGDFNAAAALDPVAPGDYRPADALNAPTSLAAFAGAPLDGTWTLNVRDDAGLDLGTIDSLSIALVSVNTNCPPACGSADFDGDGDSGTDADIEAFFACLGGNCCATCGTADFDVDGDSGTDADIEAFFRVLGGGTC